MPMRRQIYAKIQPSDSCLKGQKESRFSPLLYSFRGHGSGLVPFSLCADSMAAC